MMKEKNASDLLPRHPSSRLFKALLGIAVLLCAGLLILVIYRSIGFIQTSPDAALLPTAQYLYEHPQPTLDYVQVSSQDSDTKNRICYWDHYREQDGIKTHPRLEDFPWSILILNGSRVPLNDIHIEIKVIDQKTVYLASCMYSGELSTGLHLVELHLKVNPWDTPIIYQWAMMVEE